MEAEIGGVAELVKGSLELATVEVEGMVFDGRVNRVLGPVELADGREEMGGLSEAPGRAEGDYTNMEFNVKTLRGET